MAPKLRHPAKPEEWAEKLRSFSMKVGFHISLSRAMLDYLCATASDTQWDRALYGPDIHVPDNWLASEKSLEKRGLIERKSKAWFEARKNKHPGSRAEFCEVSMCVLTPAGRLVVDLLKLAGMFVESDAAINKKARKAQRRA